MFICVHLWPKSCTRSSRSNAARPRARTSRYVQRLPECPEDGCDRPSQHHCLCQDPLADPHPQSPPLSVTTSTGAPRASWRSISKPPRSEIFLPGSRSTRKSTSLCGSLSPRATEPKTRTLCAPCLAASPRTESRLVARSSCKVIPCPFSHIGRIHSLLITSATPREGRPPSPSTSPSRMACRAIKPYELTLTCAPNNA